jgi:hypothetical protein
VLSGSYAATPSSMPDAWNTSKGLPPPLAQSQSTTLRYVSTTGSDINNGTAGAPWKTIQKAISMVGSSTSGIDQIIIKDGTYDGTPSPPFNYWMYVKVNGTSTRPVTIRAENFGKATIHAMLQVEDSSFFRLSGFVIDGLNQTSGAGLFIGNNWPVNTVEFSYNEIKNFQNPSASVVYDRGGGGVFVGTHSNSTTTNRNIYLIANTIHDVGHNYPYDHGMYLKNMASSVVVNNTFYNIKYGHGVQIYGDFDNNWVINNTFYNGATTGADGMIFAATGGFPDNNTIANNLFAKYYIDNNSIVPCDSTLNGNQNCNVTRPSSSGYAVDWCCGADSGTGNSFRNNRQWTPNVANVTRSNLWSFPSSGTTATNNTAATLSFADEANKNFRPLSGSQTINAAEDFGLIIDADRNLRNAAADIGAYEFDSASTKTGDLNGDNLVNILDLSVLLSNYGRPQSQSNNPKTDLNNDGMVSIFDLSVLLSNYGK